MVDIVHILWLSCKLDLCAIIRLAKCRILHFNIKWSIGKLIAINTGVAIGSDLTGRMFAMHLLVLFTLWLIISTYLWMSYGYDSINNLPAPHTLSL